MITNKFASLTEKDFELFTTIILNSLIIIENMKAYEQEYYSEQWAKQDMFSQQGYSMALAVLSNQDNFEFEQTYDCDEDNFTEEQIEELNKKVIEQVEADWKEYNLKVKDLNSQVHIQFGVNKSKLHYYGLRK